MAEALRIYLIFGLALLACWAKSQSEIVNVHLVPHSHDDVGWLKTVDQYFSGTERQITPSGVRYIIDSVVHSLQDNPNRTFIFVEMAFFARWWKDQTPRKKEMVKKLVSNKQLEFVNAGWCMNDEATTDYNAIIDQVSTSYASQ